jgi:hypothetical protein
MLTRLLVNQLPRWPAFGDPETRSREALDAVGPDVDMMDEGPSVTLQPALMRRMPSRRDAVTGRLKRCTSVVLFVLLLCV